MKDLIKRILKEETESPEVMNTSKAEDIHKINIAFIQDLILSRVIPHICYMDVIYNGYADEYRVELTIKGGLTQWYSNSMSNLMSDIENQAKEIKGIKLNLYMPRFIDNCEELDPGIQRL
jgi:hypothetical protein